MSSTINDVAIDSTMGGLGDIWMRLSALYSLAALRPELAVTMRIPRSLVALAQIAWPDRFAVMAESLPGAIYYSHLGLRHLAAKLCRGERFLSPFTQLLRRDRKIPRLKDRVNDALFDLLAHTGRLLLPNTATVDAYQGLHELTALASFSRVSETDFNVQAQKDFSSVRTRLQARWPSPSSPTLDCLVFAGGNAHQIMPPHWAKEHLPQATYAFFASDDLQPLFSEQGLKVVSFTSAEDILDLAASAASVLVTDSFPSHLCQSYSAATSVMLTEQVPGRTVHPAFDGAVIPSAAPCAPCKHIARHYAPCEAGREYCLTWNDRLYSAKLIEMSHR